MEGGEEVVKPRGADEVLIEANIGAGVAISEVEVKVDDGLGGHSDFIRDDRNKAAIVLGEDVGLLLDHILEEFLVHI